MANVADTYMIYQVLKRLTTPFDETEAFKLGLIDKNGKLQKKPKTQEDKKAYTYFDRFVFNLKRILHKFGLKSKFSSYAAALFLLKEQRDTIPTDLEMYNGILEEEQYLRENYSKNLSMLREDAPSNATGSAVAGTGSDPVHWGRRPGIRGNRNKVGRSISAFNFIKNRNKKKKAVKSSYPAGSFKVESINEKMMQKDVNNLEKFADRILKKYNVDVEFTKHFVNRLNDKRNSPEIKIAELQKFFKKIQRNKAKNIKDNSDTEVVLKDMSTNLNLPVKIISKGDSFEVINKTIMRKDNFSTPNKLIKYEEKINGKV